MPLTYLISASEIRLGYKLRMMEDHLTITSVSHRLRRADDASSVFVLCQFEGERTPHGIFTLGPDDKVQLLGGPGVVFDPYPVTEESILKYIGEMPAPLPAKVLQQDLKIKKKEDLDVILVALKKKSAIEQDRFGYWGVVKG